MDTQAHDIRQIARDLYPGYDRLEPLGHGGMGDLFKGRKTGLDVPVVVKIIKPKLKGRLDERQEAEILKGLKHKYLPRIYDVIENEEGFIYTIMDYIPGENLKDYVRRTGVVDQKTAYRWACQLCEVVAYLHQQTPAIIHSDIKPGNVMITPEGDICLIDFNTSMELRAGLTAIGKTKGYAAPEQYTKPEQVIRQMQQAAGLPPMAEEGTVMVSQEDSVPEETIFLDSTGHSKTGQSKTGTSTKSPETTGRSSSVPSWLFRSSALSTSGSKGSSDPSYYGTVTKQTDVYAIGATLYFALTGKAPPHALEPARPLSSYRLPISRSMVQIIQRAMEKNAADRFRDAEEMGKALREIHRLDGNYRRVRLLTVAGVLLEIALLVGGVALMTAGSARLRQEQLSSYVGLLNDVQQEKTRGNYDSALALADQAQRLEDTRMEGYAEEAAVYYDQGIHAASQSQRKEYFKKCVTTVQEILKADLTGGTAEEWHKVYFVGAESCVELENYELAQTWYRRAVEQVPTESGYRGLICAYAFAEDMDGAKAALAQMESALPGTDTKASSELIQAELCYLEKDYGGAVAHYKKLFQLTNDESLLRRAYLAANNACIYGGNAYLEESIAILEEACRRLPSAWSIYKPLLANSCYTQAYLAEEEQREQWLDKALSAFGSVKAEYLSIEDRLTMNVIRIEQDKLDEAQEDLLAMAELYPEDYRVHMRTSHLYLAQYAATYRSEYRTKAEDSYRLAKQYYEESGALDAEMILFLSSWLSYLKDEG